MHTQALNDPKRPANIREFFVQSAIVRSSAIVDRMAQLEKLVHKITCAECEDVLKIHEVGCRCKCGYSYCGPHIDCCMYSGCIKCKPDLADYCYICHLNGENKKIIRMLVCKICKSPMCTKCMQYGDTSKCHKCAAINL